jgi:uncharacterized protein (DUF58 family)
MSPTARCAWLVAAFAVSALVLPPWAAVVGVMAVLMTTLLDGLSVREPPRIERDVAEVLSRGVSTPLSVDARSRDARRVLLRQPASSALEVRAQAGSRDLRGAIVPVLRGRHRLPGVASASVGGLGLARWHHASSADTELLVYPDLPTARHLALRLRQGRAAPDGRLRRGPLGLGTDFESIRDYSADDDIRQVNWRASARLGRPMSNQYRVEQDRDVVCVIDAGRLMGSPLGSGTLLDTALDAVTAVALVADELGDHCGAVGFDRDIRRWIPPRRLGGRGVVKALFDLQPTLEDSDFERAFLRVGGSRRGLVLVFTDLVDEQAARSLVRAAPMLARRHAMVVAGVRDPALDGLLETGAGAPARVGAKHPVPSDLDDGAAGERRAELSGAVAAASVLEARAATVALLTRAGADVVLAPPDSLPERCVQAYLRAKARARL